MPYFGEIIREKEDVVIRLTPVGYFVNDSIFSILTIYYGGTLGGMVVMPNHIHLIISLPRKQLADTNNQSRLQQLMSPAKGLQPLISGSIPSVINHLKGRIKKWCNANGYRSFEWQSRYHDHVIRDSKSYNRISNYIANNIWTWNDDENNQGGNNYRKDIRS